MTEKQEPFTLKIEATSNTDPFVTRYGEFMKNTLAKFSGKNTSDFSLDQRYAPIIDGNEKYYYFVDQSGKRYCVLVTCSGNEPIDYKASEL